MSGAEAGCGAVAILRMWPAADARVGLEIEGVFGRTWILLRSEDSERLGRYLSAAAAPGTVDFRAYGPAAGHADQCGPVVAATVASPAPVRAVRAERAASPDRTGEVTDAEIEAAMAELFDLSADDVATPPQWPRPIEMGAWDTPDEVSEWDVGGLVTAAVVVLWAIGFGCFGFDSGVAWALAFGVGAVGSAAWFFARMEG